MGTNTGDHGRAQRLCAYCGIESDDLTEDHVIPRAWSGNAEAAAAPKLKVPACRPCNNRYSKVERELAVAFGLTTWTDDELMADLAASAARSLKPSAGRNDKDKSRRLLARRKFQQTQTLPWSVVDEHPDSILMGTVVDGSEQLAFSVSGEALHTMSEKIARGVWFWDTGYPLTPGYAVRTRPVKGTCPRKWTSSSSSTARNSGSAAPRGSGTRRCRRSRHRDIRDHAPGAAHHPRLHRGTGSRRTRRPCLCRDQFDVRSPLIPPDAKRRHQARVALTLLADHPCESSAPPGQPPRRRLDCRKIDDVDMLLEAEVLARAAPPRV